MAGGARERWLREEIARLAELVDAPEQDLVCFDAHVDMGCPYIVVEPGGKYHWVAKERGRTHEHRATADVDEVLYWSFEATTHSMASRWETQHRVEDQDLRIGLFAKQQELLAALNPVWALRWRDELVRRVPDAEGLLPSTES